MLSAPKSNGQMSVCFNLSDKTPSDPRLFHAHFQSLYPHTFPPLNQPWLTPLPHGTDGTSLKESQEMVQETTLQ